MSPDITNLSCPIPQSSFEEIQLAHGGGGKLMNELLDSFILPQLSQKTNETSHDSAVIKMEDKKFAFTTDSFVVDPLFFPGGNIGSLAVHGTINDLSMSGAKPLYLSCAFILEEGFPMEKLFEIVKEMKKAAMDANVSFVTGDTKVVNRGKGDGIYINTSGIGIIEHKDDISPKSINDGDLIFINGDIGRHGMCIMTKREGIELESTITSDSTPLNKQVQKLLDANIKINCLRDITRGGLNSVLIELANASKHNFQINETDLPISPEVLGACEILGLDPMHIACEGRMIGFIPEQYASKTIEILHSFGSDFKRSTIIGKVNLKTENKTPSVTLKTSVGTNRILTMQSGEQLPRIC